MANLIGWLKNNLNGNLIIPKTLTSAVFSDSGVPVSGTLDTIQTNLTNINNDLTISKISIANLKTDNVSEVTRANITTKAGIHTLNISIRVGTTTTGNILFSGILTPPTQDTTVELSCVSNAGIPYRCIITSNGEISLPYGLPSNGVSLFINGSYI